MDNELSKQEVRTSMLDALRKASTFRMHVQDLQAYVRNQYPGRKLDLLTWQHAVEDAIADTDIAWFDPGTNTRLCLPHKQNQKWQKQSGL